MAVEERQYNGLYVELMGTITSLAVAAWLARLEKPTEDILDLRVPSQANYFYDQVLNQKSQYLIEPTLSFLYKQFVSCLGQVYNSPETKLEKLLSTELKSPVSGALGFMFSKMDDSPYPFATTTAGFGSGIDALFSSEILSRLYSEDVFPGYRSAITMAKVSLTGFTATALVGIGPFDEYYRKNHRITDRHFHAVNLNPDEAVNGLDAEMLARCEHAPFDPKSGCVGLHTVDKGLRAAHAKAIPDMPTKSAIAQTRAYIVTMITNLLNWAKAKGGTKTLESIVSPIDLGFLNGTHPNLPVDPQTGRAPQSLID